METKSNNEGTRRRRSKLVRSRAWEAQDNMPNSYQRSIENTIDFSLFCFDASKQDTRSKKGDRNSSHSWGILFWRAIHVFLVKTTSSTLYLWYIPRFYWFNRSNLPKWHFFIFCELENLKTGTSRRYRVYAEKTRRVVKLGITPKTSKIMGSRITKAPWTVTWIFVFESKIQVWDTELVTWWCKIWMTYFLGLICLKPWSGALVGVNHFRKVARINGYR